MMVSLCTRSVLSAHVRSLGKNMERAASSEEERALRAADCVRFLGVCAALFQDEAVFAASPRWEPHLRAEQVINLRKCVRLVRLVHTHSPPRF